METKIFAGWEFTPVEMNGAIIVQFYDITQGNPDFVFEVFSGGHVCFHGCKDCIPFSIIAIAVNMQSTLEKHFKVA